MRKVLVSIVAGLIAVSSAAIANDGVNQGALERGDQAGVQKAVSWENGRLGLGIVGAGGVIGGLLIVLNGNGHNLAGQTCTFQGCTPPTTTTTTTTPATTTTKTTTTTTTTKPSTTTTTTTTR